MACETTPLNHLNVYVVANKRVPQSKDAAHQKEEKNMQVQQKWAKN